MADHDHPDRRDRRRDAGRSERHGFGRRGDHGGRGNGRGERDDREQRFGRPADRPGSRRSDGEQRRERKPWGRHEDGRALEQRRWRDGEGRGRREEDAPRGGRRGDRGHRRDDRGRGSQRSNGASGRPAQRQRVPEPAVPEGIEPADLDRSARLELRALGRANAENVARHLIMLQRLLNDDPQAAYEHGRYAASQAGRVAVVRESTGIAAYLAGLYTEALREIRAARRLSGLDLHRAIEADCERALGNRDKALQVVAGADPRQLDDVERAELAMVASGIRHEMGQTELGLMVIEDAIRARPTRSEILWRLHSVRADRLEDLGRQAEAQAIRERIGPDPAEQFEEEVEVFDIEDEDDDEPQQPTAEDAAAPDAEPETADAVDTAEAADSADPTASASPDDDTDEDAHWSAEFAQRVEDELTELLAEAEQDPSAPHEEV